MENIRPEKFEFKIGAFMGGCHSIEAIDSSVRYSPSFSWGSYFPEKIRFITPSPKDWIIFLQTLDELKVWEWKRRYDNFDILDGTSWTLRIIFKGRLIKSSGCNDYPVFFDDFLEALRELLGGVRLH